jgi:hypothetical protein
VLPTPNKQLRTILLIAGAALAVAGCEATGDVGGTRTFSNDAVPFVFEVPSEFTDETVDRANSRGDVVAAAGLSKVDVIAVRKAPGAAQLPTGPQRHEVLGKQVTSELHPVEGQPGWVVECQYTDDRQDKVRSACRAALESVKRK